MLKKLIPLIVSVAALLAFGAPAAQASGPLITDANGNAATAIIAESTNTTTVTSNGTIECQTTKFEGTVTTNGTTVHGSGTGEGKGTVGEAPHDDHCGVAVSNGQARIVDYSFKTYHLDSSGGGKTNGTTTFTYTYEVITIFGNAHCTFEGTEVAVTRTGTDTINLNGILVKAGGGFLCAGEGTFNGDFTVRDQNGEPVVIH